MSVCLVPVNVTNVESSCVCVLGGEMRHMCVHPWMLFNDAVICWGYTAAVVGEYSKSMAHP